MINIENGLKNINKDFNTMSILIVNILIILMFSLWMIYKIMQLRKKTILDQKIRTVELERIKKLLSEGHSPHVINLIDTTIKGRKKK